MLFRSVTGTNVAGNSSATSAATGTVAPAPPVNTVRPVISGTLDVGQTLTATDGTWTGTAPISYTYQWRRCDSDGTNCADIAGATGATYDIVETDAGHALRIAVKATNAAPGSATATSDPTAAVSDVAPDGLTLPVITGTPEEGSALTVSNGTWSGTAPFTYMYKWQRCDASGSNCSDIAGATSASYEAGPADIGRKLRAVVTATNGGGSDFQTADVVGPVAAARPTSTSPPVISGETVVGSTLNATTGTWKSSTPLTYEYQWERCDATGSNCVAISGATASTYTLVAGDEGAVIRVVVTATNAGGSGSSNTPAKRKVLAATAAGQTPAPAAGPPSDTAGSKDLSADPDSLVSDSRCVMLAGGAGFRRIEVKGSGSVRQRVKVTGAVFPKAPARVTVDARRLRSV